MAHAWLLTGAAGCLAGAGYILVFGKSAFWESLQHPRSHVLAHHHFITMRLWLPHPRDPSGGAASDGDSQLPDRSWILSCGAQCSRHNAIHRAVVTRANTLFLPLSIDRSLDPRSRPRRRKSSRFWYCTRDTRLLRSVASCDWRALCALKRHASSCGFVPVEQKIYSHFHVTSWIHRRAR